jgi:hypothetical protein
MLVRYCDLCTIPLKDGESYILYITPPATMETMHKSYQDVLNSVSKNSKEVCPRCKDIFDKMFELRLEKLCELTDEINNIIKLPTKLNPKERKHREKK